MKLKYFVTLIVLTGLTYTVKAQDDTKQTKLMIFGVPQYLLTNCLRLDFDVHKKETRNWLVISPYYYFDKSSVDLLNLGGNDDIYDVYGYDQLIGLGLGLSKKIFMTKKSYTNGFYLSYGGTYKYFDIDGNGYTWVEYTGDDGLIYQEMKDIKYKLTINSFNVNAAIGYQLEPFEALYIDLYMGFGLKYSVHNSPQNVTVKYNRGNLDYGYTGTQFIGGMRIGIRL